MTNKTMSIRVAELTPVGLQTQEGIARVNRAVERQTQAINACADALADLLRAYEHRNDPSEDHQHDVRHAKACIAARRAADEEFLRALSGNPPARDHAKEASR